ncbi:MAG: hypothetical protein FJ173_08665, partial [Gammaproteobacteria bacterium]|nr:hypothetical protein [Gammaproteobacteria bacterium]
MVTPNSTTKSNSEKKSRPSSTSTLAPAPQVQPPQRRQHRPSTRLERVKPLITRGAFRTRDGSQLTVYDWPVEGAALTALIVHGLGEHSGRYELLARWLNSRGVAVRAYD